MKTTFTPGPWEVDYDASVCMGGQVIGHCAPDKASYAEKMANARLIAAAPDLLAALEVLLDKAGKFEAGGMKFKHYFGEAVFNAHAAIAKATQS